VEWCIDVNILETIGERGLLAERSFGIAEGDVKWPMISCTAQEEKQKNNVI
jgi:hypothetical protein